MPLLDEGFEFKEPTGAFQSISANLTFAATEGEASSSLRVELAFEAKAISSIAVAIRLLT